MTKIVVCGASGNIGGKIANLLLERIDPRDLSLVTRSPAKLAGFQAKGVSVHAGDYDSVDALDRAYAGKDALMLISGLDVTNRVPQHRNAINAAKKAGIKHIVYTSVAGIHPKNPTLSAGDHIQTESDLRNSGLSFTALRDATYAEIFPTLAAAPALRTGQWIQAAGEGRLAPVSRWDIALSAVHCLLDSDRHGGAIYEISGPELLTFRQIAALTSEFYGVPIDYVSVTPDEKFAQFDAMGVPRKYDPNMPPHPDAQMWFSEEMVSADIAFAQDYHAILTRHVHFITGKEPYTLREVYEMCRGKDYNDC